MRVAQVRLSSSSRCIVDRKDSLSPLSTELATNCHSLLDRHEVLVHGVVAVPGVLGVDAIGTEVTAGE